MTELDGADLADAAELFGADMPNPSEYLSARQRNGKPLGADEIFRETWLWLKERGCERLVNPRLLESYAQVFARFIQCEEAVSQYGLIGKHTTRQAVRLQAPSFRWGRHSRSSLTCFGTRFSIS